MIKKHLGRQEALVDTNVIGEHGPNAVFLRSSSTVDGRPISSLGLDLEQVEQDTLSEGFLEMRALGYTNMGVVASCFQLFEALSSPSYPKRLPLGSYYDRVFVELPVKRTDGKNNVLWEDIDRREKALLDVSVDALLEGSIKIMKDAARPHKKIIIVDDEPDEAYTLAQSLQKCILDDSELNKTNDIDFTVARSGEELIQFIQEQPVGFDLAIVDQYMPGISGIDALRKAREIQPNLECIILLGASEAADLQRMFRDEGLRFVEKPVLRPEAYDLCEQPNYTVFKDMLEYASPLAV
jgi:CheY-like chemotaxis protein